MLQRIIEWLDANLVPDWREGLSFLSIKGAGLFGAGITALAMNAEVLLAVIQFMPTDPLQRFIAALAVGVIAWVGPSALRLWGKKTPDEPAV